MSIVSRRHRHLSTVLSPVSHSAARDHASRLSSAPAPFTFSRFVPSVAQAKQPQHRRRGALAWAGVLTALLLASFMTATAQAAAPTSGFFVGASESTSGAALTAPLGAAPAGPASMAAGGLGARTGRLLPAGRGPDGRPAITIDTGAAFDMIGVLFRSSADGVRNVGFRLRVSPDLQTWTPWFSVKADAQSGPTGSVLGKSDLVTEPVWVGPARYVQYEVEDRGATPAPVSDVRFACVESKVTDTAIPAAAPQSSAPAAAMLGAAQESRFADEPATAVRLGEPAEPVIVTRAQWGANEAYRSAPPSYGVVRCAFVHHTVNANNYTRAQAPALVRGIYYYHTKVNGWNDIGYNFLIDRFGTIYEGRYGGVTKAVIGAQVLGFNSMSTGVSLIGTFQTVAPSKAALTSLEELLAWKLDLSHLDPLGTARVRCSTTEMYRAGQWVTVPVILGHRQVNYTECPGNVLFGLLPTVRQAVAGIGDPKIYAPAATPAVFSPNGDGVRDATTLHAGLSGPDDWTITVRDAADSVVDQFSGTGAAASSVWDGRDAAGHRLPDGTYTVGFAATSKNGTARPATAAVRLDTTSPVISGLRVTPSVISPNGDGVADSARVAFGVSERCKVGLTVLDAQGAVVRTVAPVWTAAGATHMAWDGKVDGQGGLVPAADGAYTVVVSTVDVAGNSSTASHAVTVDDTLGHAGVAPAWLSPNGDGVDDAAVVSFRTTRAARVSIVLTGSNGAVVRRVSLGELASGRHKWSWDGRTATGVVVGGGTYVCTVTAANEVGKVAERLSAHVDTVVPVGAWRSATVTIKRGKTVHAAYSVVDAQCPKAAVTIVVRRASGALVATLTVPAVATGVRQSWSFKPRRRGKYTASLTAVDLAGNRQQTAAALTIVVK